MKLLALSCVLLAACATPPPRDLRQVTTADGRLAASLECTIYDPAAHDATCKVFHHVWAPDGRLLTKALGGLFPHHHGLFLGWNHVHCRGHAFDFWHCNHGESQRFVGWQSPAELGLPDDWQVARIDWLGADGQAVLHESRRLRATSLGDGSTELLVATELRADGATVQLDGDPQHAGHQFRALQQFAEPDATPVRYVRPPSAQGTANDVWTDCDWIAAVLPFAEAPVTVLRVEGPHNAKPTQWSTRGYGRFGAMCKCDLRKGEPLRLQYAYVVALGERDAAWCVRTAAEATAALTP